MDEAILRISGHVQGIGYRQFLREAAERHGVTGFCRNLPDGSIEVVAQGAHLGEFLEEARRGPEFADVEEVQEQRRQPVSKYQQFSITG